MVSPDVAYFGQKDAQQALVIARLVRDLNMPVRIEVCATVREPDGLAMSSRNAHCRRLDRDRARALHRALLAAEQAVADGVRDPAAVSARALSELNRAELEPDYLALVSAGHAQTGARHRGRGARARCRPGRNDPLDRQPPALDPSRSGKPTNGRR